MGTEGLVADEPQLSGPALDQPLVLRYDPASPAADRLEARQQDLIKQLVQDGALSPDDWCELGFLDALIQGGDSQCRSAEVWRHYVTPHAPGLAESSSGQIVFDVWLAAFEVATSRIEQLINPL